MSTPILPFAVWESGTNQNSIPANDNSLRHQILNGLVISESTDAQPGSPDEGDIYIMTGSASGAQWSTFDEFDLAIYDGAGTWHAYAPVEGIVVNVAGTLKRWNGSAYVNVTSGGGGVAPVVTVTGTSTTIDPDTDAGAYLRFTNGSAKTATFDSADGFTVDQEFHITNRASTGNLTLTEAGTMTLNPPKGGSLVLEPGDTVTVKVVDTDEADVMGSTEAA